MPLSLPERWKHRLAALPAFALALIAVLWAATSVYDLVRSPSVHALIRAVAFVGVAAVALWVAYRRRRDVIHRDRRRPLIKVIGWAAFSLAAGHWAAHATWEAIEHVTLENAAFAAGFFALFALVAMRTYDVRSALAIVRTLKQSSLDPKSPGAPRRALVLLISTPRTAPSRAPDGKGWVIEDRSADGQVSRTTLTGTDLDADDTTLLRSGLKWNWHPLLRALRPHLATLRRVHLVGSSDESTPAGHTLEGSHRHLGLCAEWIHGYVPSAQVTASLEPVGFEDLEALIAHLVQVLASLRQPDISDDQIVFDATGGQKTTSVAAAIVTLNLNAKFQYVQTNDPYQVREYDVRYDMPGALHEH